MIEEPTKLTIRQNFPRPTPAQVDAFRGLQTGFVCDAMDGTGGLDTVIGPVGGGGELPASAVGVALVADNGPEEILATLGAMHIMQQGDMIVAATKGCQSCAAAGDIFMNMMKNKGAAGFVTDGAMRDYDGIVEAGLPAWCNGLNPNSPFAYGPGRVGFGAVVGGQTINSGDIIVADINGVVVVPFAQIDAVIAQLARIKEVEDALEAKVRAGAADTSAIAKMLEDGSAVIVD
ncbi:RraA family protein [Yoonia sediminilitoris]|uniref:Putative 4-hydroxy-4-methyl-2-oxoglutarate aldolase n=1 Tax=Yoonia sediminilitoris TaxID=1286148 RepID=A0A2T6KR83_9RHOB|nr:RraA family protein [Yoonia sediminilitoris]PUB19045.1 regulator of RNase E activity RraA [Yoonia sediminilitoris]RCW99213.1 regulator of RNase E activity RraA [Yoonia sediminilitoris]